jgi:hypothetical protein
MVSDLTRSLIGAEIDFSTREPSRSREMEAEGRLLQTA